MTSELDRFKTILATICISQSELSLAEALILADQVEKEMQTLPVGGTWEPDLSDVESIARWLREQPSVRDYIARDRKIDAIKEARSLLDIGLREAKDAVELAFPRVIPPF